ERFILHSLAVRDGRLSTPATVQQSKAPLGATRRPSRSAACRRQFPRQNIAPARGFIQSSARGVFTARRLCPVKRPAGAKERVGGEMGVLKGAWAQDQQVQATVKVPGAYSTVGGKEVELRIRTTIIRNSITGYELNCSVVPAVPYLSLVRWNGSL